MDVVQLFTLLVFPFIINIFKYLLFLFLSMYFKVLIELMLLGLYYELLDEFIYILFGDFLLLLKYTYHLDLEQINHIDSILEVLSFYLKVSLYRYIDMVVEGRVLGEYVFKQINEVHELILVLLDLQELNASYYDLLGSTQDLLVLSIQFIWFIEFHNMLYFLLLWRLILLLIQLSMPSRLFFIIYILIYLFRFNMI